MIQIKAIAVPAAQSYRMGNVITLEAVGDERREDAMGRVRGLRKQADWCVEMAAKALTRQMFQKYVTLAAAYQQEAAALERDTSPGGA